MKPGYIEGDYRLASEAYKKLSATVDERGLVLSILLPDNYGSGSNAVWMTVYQKPIRTYLSEVRAGEVVASHVFSSIDAALEPGPLAKVYDALHARLMAGNHQLADNGEPDTLQVATCPHCGGKFILDGDNTKTVEIEPDDPPEADSEAGEFHWFRD
jgi:hypothetical protein